MEPIYVTGHRNPDTDSIVAAIAYASLRNALGDRAYTAARIGGISDQTQLVLDKFGFAPPPLLRTVRTQVRDLDFDTPPVLSQAVTVHHAWALMQDEGRHIESMPVATEDGRLFGMLTTSDIAAYEMRFVSDAAVAEMTCAGSLLIVGIGLNLLGLTKLKLANYLPAVFLPLLLVQVL